MPLNVGGSCFPDSRDPVPLSGNTSDETNHQFRSRLKPIYIISAFTIN